MINLPIKFQMPVFTRYTEIWKASQNVENGVVWGLGVNQGHWKQGHSIERIWVPIAFRRKYVNILHRLWDITIYWSKSADVNLPHLYLASTLGVMSLEFRRYFGIGKPWLSYGVLMSSYV